MSFSLSIARWSKKTQHNADVVRRAVALKLFSSIIRDTPVDTGRLRGAWRCSVGHPDLTGAPAGQATAAAEAIAGITDTVNGSAPGSTLILTNPLPYVFRIEYEGWSHTKAPQGMVRRNIARFRQLVTQMTHELK